MSSNTDDLACKPWLALPNCGCVVAMVVDIHKKNCKCWCHVRDWPE